MRKTLVAGNWKMNASQQQTQALLSALTEAAPLPCDVAVFPPSPYLIQARDLLSGSTIALGGQDCSAAESGAFTGDISSAMLADVGATMVLVGHSERRTLNHETDQLVIEKTRQALKHGLTVVVCVGETLAERQAGHEEKVVGTQCAAIIAELSDSEWQNIIIAYEPVWAIGTGETASPAQAQAMHSYIRQLIAARSVELADTTRILYGGSVKGANASELFAQPDIDGGLVGGASLDAVEFLSICRA
ncbi:MAG: triose-phosphate isomerase [Oleibacter sp.]|nr:triose-phosphate isomerase [Thalassolituus sp.]